MEELNNIVEFQQSDGVCIAVFAGHLSDGLSEKLVSKIESRVESGIKNFLFDFSQVPMLDSPAIAAVLRCAEIIVDDNEGEMAFCGLNEICGKVLEMVGVFLYANRFETRQVAMSEIVD